MAFLEDLPIKLKLQMLQFLDFVAFADLITALPCMATVLLAHFSHIGHLALRSSQLDVPDIRRLTCIIALVRTPSAR